MRFGKLTYVGDPINAVHIYNEKEVDELVLLDIGARRNSSGIQFGYLKELFQECFVPVAYGGGINSLDEMRRLLRSGVEKVSLNTASIENPDLVKEAAETFGTASVIVSIDVKKNVFGRYQVYSRCGRFNTRLDPLEYALRAEELGAGELILNSIDRDGTMTGYDLELIRPITARVNIPVIALGGAGKLEDLRKAIEEGGASASAAGSLFVFQGKRRAVLINYPTQNELQNLWAG